MNRLLFLLGMTLCFLQMRAADDTNVIFSWKAAANTVNSTSTVYSNGNEENGSSTTNETAWVSSVTTTNGFVADANNGYYFSTGKWERALFIDKSLFKSDTKTDPISVLKNDYPDLKVAITVKYLVDGATSSDPAQISPKYYSSSDNKWYGFCNFSSTSDTKQDYKDLGTTDGSVTLTFDNLTLLGKHDMALEGKHLKIIAVYLSYFSKTLAKERNAAYLGNRTEDTNHKQSSGTYTDAGITPYYISDWYQRENNNPLDFSSVRNYVVEGDVMRVVFRNAEEDSYCFLKNWKTSEAIMSGSDKFSINGWKYMDITVNTTLKDLIDKNNLWIGGNDFTLSGIYFLHDGKTYEDWADRSSEARSTYSQSKTPSSWSDYLDISGDYFKYKNGNSSNGQIDNTKNAIIRVNYTSTGSIPQIAIQDPNADSKGYYGYYTRYRASNNGSYVYHNYLDLSMGTNNVDIVFSDAITKFHTVDGNNVPVTGADGVMTGMMSNIQQHGIRITGQNITINSVSIIPTEVALYVSGKAAFTHKLSSSIYKPIALSYNMTSDEMKKVFGSDAKILELGNAEVTKKVNSTKGYDYYVKIHFKSATSIRANYPYIVKLSADKSDFTFDGVRANTRDYATYTFYTPAFTYGNDFTDDEKSKFDSYLKDQKMTFISTAPVIKMKNNSTGEVENITGVEDYTTLSKYDASTETSPCDYFFYNGALYPNVSKDRQIKSGLAYVQLTHKLKALFDNPNVVMNSGTTAKRDDAVTWAFEEDDVVSTDITTHTVAPTAKATGIYNLNGQKVREGNSLAGLPAGMYIMNGHQYIVK